MNHRVRTERHAAGGYRVANQHAFTLCAGLICPCGKVQDLTALADVFGDDPRDGCDVAVPWPVRAVRVAVSA